MKKNKNYLMVAAMLVLPGMMALAGAEASSLDSLLEQARSDEYITPEANDILQAEESFTRWLAADDRLEAVRYPESPGYDEAGLNAVALFQPDIVVLTENDSDRRGRGFFAARIEGGAPLLIQAPHQYHDLRTGIIAQKLFLESDAMSAVWNTVHRYQSDDSDLVHVPDSYLHALSRAFAAVYPDGRILQLHGFSSAKRVSPAGREAEAILSDGTRNPPESLARLTDCLSQRLGIRAMLYPRDVQELGATTNTVGADLRGHGFGGFVHLELDADLRKRLVEDADARNSLISCVAETRL